MKSLLVLMMALVALGSAARAEVAPVIVRVPETEAWVGERVRFYVDLRAPGPFEGTAGFDLPQVPAALLVKIGSPVVSSQDLEGESWFVQEHEFALFSQKAGLLTVPAFSVRFASREGFTGPAQDRQSETPVWEVAIRRPPGSDGIGFLVTTESMDITETWNPQPGPAQVGAAFERTIVQRATQMTGMALAPAPVAAPGGIRVYAGRPEVSDDTERGRFLGLRRDTLTYLLAKPGTFTVPALTYVWWNPNTETLQSKTLPAATFVVAPPALSAAAGKVDAARLAWPLLFGAVSAVALISWQRRRLSAWVRPWWKAFNPPDRAAGRKLLRGCRRRDAPVAERAWIAWRETQDASFQLDPELHYAVLELQRHLFGSMEGVPWQGDKLARAFRKTLTAKKAHMVHESASALPLLNPRKGETL